MGGLYHHMNDSSCAEEVCELYSIQGSRHDNDFKILLPLHLHTLYLSYGTAHRSLNTSTSTGSADAGGVLAGELHLQLLDNTKEDICGEGPLVGLIKYDDLHACIASVNCEAVCVHLTSYRAGGGHLAQNLGQVGTMPCSASSLGLQAPRVPAYHL